MMVRFKCGNEERENRRRKKVRERGRERNGEKY
jgi:hypothetical protein